MDEKITKKMTLSNAASKMAYMIMGTAVANCFYENEVVRDIVFMGLISVLMILMLATQKAETGMMEEYHKIVIQKLQFEMLPMQFFTALEKSNFDDNQREEIYKIFYGEYLEVFEHGTNDKNFDK